MLSYPIFPVRYAFVRSSAGLENMVAVSSYSTSSPKYMNIDLEEIRMACPMLWVTIRIVTSFCNSNNNS